MAEGINVGTAFVTVRPSTEGFEDDAKKSIGAPLAKMAAAAAGAFAAVKVKDFLGGAIDAAAESNKVAAQTEAVIKSTGAAAGVTADHVGALAHQLQGMSGVSDEAIQAGQNMLLTFTNIKNGVGEGNDIFDQATKTLLDMSVAMGTDAKGNAIQLGKALNDLSINQVGNVGALSALARVGVIFSDQQEDQIKTAIKAGDNFQAQRLILAELNKEFGGSAKAAGDAQTPMQRLGIAFGDFQENVGTKLIPIIESFAKILTKVTEFIDRNRAVMGPAILVLGSMAAAVAATSAALSAATTVAAAFGKELTLSTGPIGLTVAAIAALAAGLIYAYTHSETFRKVVDGAFDAIAIAAGVMRDVVLGAVRTLVDTFLAEVEWIVKGAAKAFGWVPGIGGKLKEAAKAVEAFRDDVNSALGGIHDKTINLFIKNSGADASGSTVSRKSPDIRAAGLGELLAFNDQVSAVTDAFGPLAGLDTGTATLNGIDLSKVVSAWGRWEGNRLADGSFLMQDGSVQQAGMAYTADELASILSAQPIVLQLDGQVVADVVVNRTGLASLGQNARSF